MPPSTDLGSRSATITEYHPNGPCLGKNAQEPTGRHHGRMPIRPTVQALLQLGRMPSDDEEFDDGRVRAWVGALEALDTRLTDEEAIALLDSFPLDDSLVYEVAWSLLHAVESAPCGLELVEQLDDRSWWVRYLRERAERSGGLRRALD